MAQWIGQFSGHTHATAVEDAETLLRHAVNVFETAAETPGRRKRRRNVVHLAERVLRARLRFLKARIAERETSKGALATDRAAELASLAQRLAATEGEGVTGVLAEFSALEALEAES
jgi:hypothetical protein